MILDANQGELLRLAAEAARFCRQHSLGQGVEYDLVLVLEELFTNTLRHGGCERREGIARAELSVLPNGVGIEYADRCSPFDPTSVPPPDLTAPLESRRAGGLGIHLVRQLVRDLRYQRVEGWNRLTMRRPIPAGER